MSAREAIERIQGAVRKVFLPTFIIEFSEGLNGMRGVITHVRVNAWVDAERLFYDQSRLLRLLEADAVESDGDEYALLSGTIDGVHYELRLFAEPQTVNRL